MPCGFYNDTGEWVSLNRAAGFVYLMWCRKGVWKIGRSTTPARRAAELGFKVIHVIRVRNMARTEHALQRFFGHRRTRGGYLRNEYFNLSPADVRTFKNFLRDPVSPLPRRRKLIVGNLIALKAPKRRIVREYFSLSAGGKCEEPSCGHTLIEGLDAIEIGYGNRRRCRQCATIEAKENPK